ncbi:MAG: 2,3,4,5-tetrahydropyridine-2,6-dicarboxylate N-succinyltransferase [Proteobacteria bacterium]|nr:2,3,4,5-tetrahydropyridine-2,6-dicarboxylate N-succinyltransferase [Pseudomonadota bacterium]
MLDSWFPHTELLAVAPPTEIKDISSEELAGALGGRFADILGHDARRGVDVVAVRATVRLDQPPIDARDVYLRLHLLSRRLIRPHGANLDGLFDLLSNVAWTSVGVMSIDRVDETRAAAMAARTAFEVYCIDKIPRMTDYVAPSGVRIADVNRVRLGAHLAPGTTVMHEGFCNFNAGTLGASMVEGRISAGVVVGDQTDIGGSASIMGTLSGGGREVISIGERCLLGANSGIGISLGDNCVVEAGCYVTAGSRVTFPDGRVVKAASLSGQSNLLFRRNSQTGALECLPRNAAWAGLNAALHQN